MPFGRDLTSRSTLTARARHYYLLPIAYAMPMPMIALIGLYDTYSYSYSYSYDVSIPVSIPIPIPIHIINTLFSTASLSFISFLIEYSSLLLYRTSGKSFCSDFYPLAHTSYRIPPPPTSPLPPPPSPIPPPRELQGKQGKRNINTYHDQVDSSCAPPEYLSQLFDLFPVLPFVLYSLNYVGP